MVWIRFFDSNLDGLDTNLDTKLGGLDRNLDTNFNERNKIPIPRLFPQNRDLEHDQSGSQILRIKPQNYRPFSHAHRETRQKNINIMSG